MPTFANLEQEWTRQRARLEREIRVLVVHDDPRVRKDLDQLLFRSRISARAVESAEGLRDLAQRDHYSLMILATHLPGMQELELARQLRRKLPEVDLLLLAHELDVDLVRQAIDVGVMDIIVWPMVDPSLACDRIKDAVRRHVDSRMRAQVLRQLRRELDELDQEARFRVTAALEHRLEHLKRRIGGFDRVLVVEGADADLRRLSESLLVAGFDVEAADVIQEGWERVDQGGLHLVVMETVGRISEEQSPLSRVRAADPLTELVLVSREPTLAQALVALRHGVALFQRWPPADGERMVTQIQAVCQDRRRSRLLDSLLAALFWESRGVLQGGAPEDPPRADTQATYDEFCRLAGMERAMPVEMAQMMARTGATNPQVMEDVVDHILGRETVVAHKASPTAEVAWPAAETNDDRRAHHRVQENQFVRFRPARAPTSVLAYLGDISEGGIFVRTQRLQARGTALTVDVNVEHEGLGYLVRCQGEVAWVARDSQQVAYGPGFGVRFCDPPADVQLLLKRVVRGRA